MQSRSNVRQTHSMIVYRRDAIIVAVLALIVGTAMAAAIKHPGYTDAYYYFNAGQRLIQGKGLTDAALWTYLGAPAALPVPSHLYWMPLTSLVAAGSMALFGPSFDGAQVGFVLVYAGLALVGFTVGALIGESRRLAWFTALLTMFSGFFMPFWTTTDGFALYGLTGSLALLSMGLGRKSGNWRWFAFSGAMCGLAHLTRADGLLLLGVLVIVAVTSPRPLGSLATLLPRPVADPKGDPLSANREGEQVDTDVKLLPYRGKEYSRVTFALISVAAYLIVMTPWFVRNLNAVGTILPAGGFQTAWMRDYNEIVNYPPDISLQSFLAWGTNNILASRLDALTTNLGHFVAEQGWVVLWPFMLIGLWRRRSDPLLTGFWLYAFGLFLVMTFVFTFPGPRGGLFHSESALLPFWAALGVLGLDDVIAWLSRRRRWRQGEARAVFGAALLLWAIGFSAVTFIGRFSAFNSDGYFPQLAKLLPPTAIVMINDPSALYYYTRLSGVVIPNAPSSVIPELAQRYGVNTLVLDGNVRALPMRDLYEGRESPPFLDRIYHDENIQIYRVK